MGQPKLALPLGSGTVIGRVTTALHEAGVEEILVVVGPHVADLCPLAEAAGASVLRLDAETPDMRTTVEHGLRWLQEHRSPDADDVWLLCPADHPTLQPEVVRQLMQAYRSRLDCSIVIPTFADRRGHPALLAWKHVTAITSLASHLGLNSYLRSRESETLLLPVGTDHVLVDLDTPEDYERLVRLFSECPTT
jgi:molybdenum cofactor cytidylyltransferase